MLLFFSIFFLFLKWVKDLINFDKNQKFKRTDIK